MALQKQFTLPNGVTGNYIRVGTYIVDRITREASICFMLHTSAAYASAEPICMIAKLRLNGTKFDQYLGADVLEEATTLAQFYTAAKAETLLAGAGLTVVNLNDAIDV